MICLLNTFYIIWACNGISFQELNCNISPTFKMFLNKIQENTYNY